MSFQPVRSIAQYFNADRSICADAARTPAPIFARDGYTSSIRYSQLRHSYARAYRNRCRKRRCVRRTRLEQRGHWPLPVMAAKDAILVPVDAMKKRHFLHENYQPGGTPRSKSSARATCVTSEPAAHVARPPAVPFRGRERTLITLVLGRHPYSQALEPIWSNIHAAAIPAPTAAATVRRLTIQGGACARAPENSLRTAARRGCPNPETCG